MHVTCRSSEKSKELLVIEVDGSTWKEVAIALFGRSPQLPKDCACMEELEEAFQKLLKRQSKNYVLRRLAAKSYLTAELKALLLEKGVPEPLADLLLEECRQYGYLDDQQWLFGYVNRHISQRDGPRKIIAKLKARGALSQEAAEAVTTNYSNENQQEQVRALLSTRYKKSDLTDFHERQKVMAALARKGYDFDLIRDAMKQTLNGKY